ncbi:hypothetical protein CV102_00575 [Natronococcus pandeyae]|uniref:Uncharacterized protein n=1 Tax=Natronococcus pandeyae TaxID=2055836 RepID=A0A8J8Q8A2_9EURY|nr:hypothetical protein [Natronococcus pandeyae]TYL40693.1 hypothetical protein CV102_00575 [Natronococcus pandeyae]
MNHLREIGDRAWHLPNHAHLVVYEREDGERGLLTVYDCGATQSGPKAQLLGTLESVDADAAIEPNPTGRVVTLHEPATLERTAENQYRIT